jgi:hypothetical protein
MSTTTRKRTGATGEGSLRGRRARLLNAIASLEASEKGARRLIALAEAEFRLAMLPGIDSAEAIDRLRRAINYDPLHPKFFLHLGRLRQENGDYAGALHDYRRAVRLAPASHRARLHLALVLLELEDGERQLGRALLEALARGSEEKIAELIKDLDALIANRIAAAGGTDTRASAVKPRRANESGNREESDLQGRDGSWRILLLEQLSRPKPPKQIDKLLAAGARCINGQQGLAEYAIACLCLMLDGRDVDSLPGNGNLRSHGGHAAIQLLEATSALAKIEEPRAFVEQAVRELEAKVLPAEVVCWLHYSKFGPDTSQPVAEALALLDAYPPGLIQHHCFQELRLTTLDGYARKAWAEGRFDRAQLLWREASSLDSQRTAIAHNLALLAAQTRSRDDYAAAWNRSAELRYLRAAALSDVRVDVDDRRALHVAFVQQIRQRYCGESKSRQQPPQDEELLAWLTDGDALEIWLREWDLYYLNSRLKFRSPVHMLGVPRDASPEVTADGRDALLHQVESLLRGKPWSGINIFCDLSAALVNDAFERASDLVQRARDSYYDYEKPEADALAEETIERGRLLHDMMRLLTNEPRPANLRLGCTITRHQLLLPWAILQPMCADRGMVERDVDLLKIWESDLLNVAVAGRSEPTSDRELSEQLSALDECIAILPQRIELRLLCCQLLLTAKRNDDAYSVALDALAALSEADDLAGAGDIEQNLLTIIDNVAFEAIPEHLRQPESLEVAEETLREGRSVLDRYPRSASLRSYLTRIMIQIADADHTKAAIELLDQGLDLALNEEQTKDFQDLLSKARRQLGVAEAMEKVKAASNQVNNAVARINQNASADAIRGAQQAVATAIEAAEEAVARAEKAGLEEIGEQARNFLAQMREVQRKLRSR